MKQFFSSRYALPLYDAFFLFFGDKPSNNEIVSISTQYEIECKKNEEANTQKNYQYSENIPPVVKIKIPRAQSEKRKE